MSRMHWPSWPCSTATLPLTKRRRPRNPDPGRKRSRLTAHQQAASSNSFVASPAPSGIEETSSTIWQVGEKFYAGRDIRSVPLRGLGEVKAVDEGKIAGTIKFTKAAAFIYRALMPSF